jgi:hypothetical protein
MYYSEMFHLVFFYNFMNFGFGLEVVGNLKITVVIFSTCNALFSHVNFNLDEIQGNLNYCGNLVDL